MPACDEASAASMLCGAARGAPEDVFSWLMADQEPAEQPACSDNDFLEMCTAFGLL
jgi:hypothetical protein